MPPPASTTISAASTVGKGLRTSNKRVYAIGDAAGGHFTHTANYHAGIVLRNALFRLPAKANDETVPWVTFTDPELAHVGLTEAQARERHKTIRVLRWPYHENDRAQAERETHGHIKIITKKNGLHSRRHHRRRACGRTHHHLDARACAGAQHPRHDGNCDALSDFVRNRETRGDHLLFVKFE